MMRWKEGGSKTGGDEECVYTKKIRPPEMSPGGGLF